MVDQLDKIVQLDWQTILLIFISLFLCIKFYRIVMALMSRREIEVTVNHKARVDYPSKYSSMYLIYTDKGVFRNTDASLFLKFNSSDIYGELTVGNTYKLGVYGKRSRIFTTYPNIYKIVK